MSLSRSLDRKGAAYEGIQRPMLPVFDSGFETTNASIVMEHPMRELFISNDSMDDDLTFVVNCEMGTLEFKLGPNGTFNERLPEFTSVDVTAQDNWRWYVRSGRIT